VPANAGTAVPNSIAATLATMTVAFVDLFIIGSLLTSSISQMINTQVKPYDCDVDKSSNSQFMFRRTMAALALGLSLGLLVVGCASQKPSDAPALTVEEIKAIGEEQMAQGNTTQATALADGIVEEAEYAAAFDDLSACLVERGYPAPPSWTSPIDGHSILFEMQTGGRTVEEKERDTTECVTAHWETVAAVYQDLVPFAMDEALRVNAVSCLNDLGYDLGGSESTPTEMGGPDALVDGVISDRANDAMDCLTDAQYELFPEIPLVNISIR